VEYTPPDWLTFSFQIEMTVANFERPIRHAIKAEGSNALKIPKFGLEKLPPVHCQRSEAHLPEIHTPCGVRRYPRKLASLNGPHKLIPLPPLPCRTQIQPDELIPHPPAEKARVSGEPKTRLSPAIKAARLKIHAGDQETSNIGMVTQCDPSSSPAQDIKIDVLDVSGREDSKLKSSPGNMHARRLPSLNQSSGAKIQMPQRTAFEITSSGRSCYRSCVDGCFPEVDILELPEFVERRPSKPMARVQEQTPKPTAYPFRRALAGRLSRGVAP